MSTISPHSIPMLELAYDTSGSTGTLALAKDGVLLCERNLIEGRRHNMELMATIAQEMARFGFKPADLSWVHVGVGPGSFTGLRTGCAAAQALALALPACRFTRVPAVDALVHGAQAAHPGRAVAVSLAWKKDTAWSVVVGGDGTELLAPAERGFDALFAACPAGTLLVGETPPGLVLPAQVTLAGSELAGVPAGSVLAVGRGLAEKGLFSSAAQLQPLYPRRPEAVTLWEARKLPAPR